MKKLFGVSMIILSISLLYLGCDKKDECEVPDLPGTWLTIEEEADLSAYQMGKLTLSPTADQFIGMLVTLNEDGSCSYESWNGNFTAETAAADTAASNYSSGVGTWQASGGIFTLNLATTYEGTYEQQCDKLIISTVLSEDLLGNGEPLSFPAIITMQKQ